MKVMLWFKCAMGSFFFQQGTRNWQFEVGSLQVVKPKLGVLMTLAQSSGIALQVSIRGCCPRRVCHWQPHVFFSLGFDGFCLMPEIRIPLMKCGRLVWQVAPPSHATKDLNYTSASLSVKGPCVVLGNVETAMETLIFKVLQLGFKIWSSKERVVDSYLIVRYHWKKLSRPLIM